MNRLNGFCANVKNPTAREVFLTDRTGWSSELAQQVEESFFFQIRLPNGTKKTTYKNRLDDVATACNCLLATRPAPLRLMDLAISSGITTNEWMRALDSLNKYFQQINRKLLPGQSTLWMDFQMDHSIKWVLLKENISSWMQQNQYGLYPRQLQSPTEIVIGWL